MFERCGWPSFLTTARTPLFEPAMMSMGSMGVDATGRHQAPSMSAAAGQGAGRAEQLDPVRGGQRGEARPLVLRRPAGRGIRVRRGDGAAEVGESIERS